MVQFHKYQLSNGLKVIFHKDETTPFIVVNTLYNVGAKDENPQKTGFAHLFEHLMFGGSVNIPDFDGPIQQVGGDSNAFTNNDYTNYYVQLPKENVETALWLESDRMISLNFSEKSLEVQQNVVVEEFRQRYLNQPYGDIWLLLRPLIYKEHPYQWSTIGKEISHIQDATLDDVKDFFFNHYAPNNAILVIAGNFDFEEMKTLVTKWFDNIPFREIEKRNLKPEPIQTEARTLTVTRDVPFHSIYKAYHMCSRLNPDYFITDLISDILSNGKSSRLYQRLVQEKKYFSDLNAYVSGDIDEGAFIVSGKLMDGTSMEIAENAILEELNLMVNDFVSDYELQKVKNKMESANVFSEIQNLNKAMDLAYYELLGNADLINQDINQYRKVTKEDIKRVASDIFKQENCSTLYYLSNNLNNKDLQN